MQSKPVATGAARTHQASNQLPEHAQLLDDKAAAAVLDVTTGTLSVWRSTGRYSIPFIKVGRKVRYRLADLQAWLDSRTRENGATA